MFYTAETGRQHATTFFNRTVDIVEPHTWVDFQAIFLVILILAGIGGLGTSHYNEVTAKAAMLVASPSL